MKIRTKYNPNPVSGAGRVTAYFNGQQKTHSWNYELSTVENHFQATIFFKLKEGLNYVDEHNPVSTETGYYFEVAA